jgi:hypothetical protein
MPWLALRTTNTGPSTGWLTSIQITAAATSATANHLRHVMRDLLQALGTEQG